MDDEQATAIEPELFEVSEKKQGGRFHWSKVKGEVKGSFALQSEPRDLQSLVTIETQEARALLTNIQYNDTLERFGYQKHLWDLRDLCDRKTSLVGLTASKS